MSTNYEWQWHGLISFFEGFVERDAPSPDDSEEIGALKRRDREAYQRLLALIELIRVLPEFADVSPGRNLTTFTLKPPQTSRLVCVSSPQKGYFSISFDDLVGPPSPDPARSVPETDIVDELKRLMLTLI